MFGIKELKKRKERTEEKICQTQISNVERQNFELDLSDTNQQSGSTDSIQTTSGIAQIFQNPVKNKKGANVK